MAFQSSVASEGPPPVLNPKTYVSPSGVYSLAVDPTDLYGRGPADYRFTKAGKIVWASRLPYTFWQASVVDSGQVAGYAYTQGWRGFSEERGVDEPGEFIVAVLSPEGKTLNEEKHAREQSRFPHTPPNPWASDTIVHASNKRFVLRVNDPDVNRHIEQWWGFDLESGKRIGTLEPGRSMPDKKDDETLFILGAQAVPGTPLVLTHWWKYVFGGNCGGVFTLVDLNDAQAKPVWSLSLDGDYSVPGNEKAEDTIQETIQREGAILDSNKSSGFAIHAVKQHQRIAFSIEKAGDSAWRVRETARTPYNFPTSEPAQEARTFPQIKLEEVAAVHLSGKGARKESPIRDIEGFGFDAEGRICVLSARKNADPHILLITQEGEVLKDLRVPVGKRSAIADISNPVNIGGAKFVTTVSEGGIDGKARCFMTDFDAATVKEVPDFRCWAITALAGFPNGRFAALVCHRMKYTASDELCLFDVQGNLIWRKGNFGYGGKPDDLLSPEDITSYVDGSTAVLDKIRHTIQLFDTNGTFLQSINLNETWKREPNYPTNIVEDRKGGFVVYDFNARFSLVRMDAKGRIESQCIPKFSDGRPVKVHGLQRSPDGRLWVSDGDVLLRLSDNGTVDRILGEEASSDTIYQPSYAVTVGPSGRIYVPDDRTNAVHVFDSDGKKRGVCVPDTTDLSETSYVQHVAVSADGNVFVLLDMTDDTYVRFDKHLKRTGRVQLDLDSVTQELYFPPSGPLCWVAGYENVFLVKDLRNTIRTISRRPDGQWLERLGSLGVAPDGSAAVLAWSQSGQVSLNTYGPTGDPRSTYVVPRGWYRLGSVAYDGQSVFFQDHNNVYIIGPNNRCIGSFRLPYDNVGNPWAGPFVTAEGKQLWFVDYEGLTLHKFAIPHPDQTSETKDHGDVTSKR